MKMRNHGKYHQQLKLVFLLIAAFFIFVIMGLSSLMLTKNWKQSYQNTVTQTVSSQNMLAEVCLSTIHSVSGRLLQNPAVYTWASSPNRSLFYYNAIKVKEELHNLVATFSALPLYPAVTTMSEDVFVIDSGGTSSKNIYFKEQTALTEEQVQYIFTYFKSNRGELIIPAYDEQGALKDLYYFLRKPYTRDDLLFFVRIPRTSLIGGNTVQEFMIYNGSNLIAYSHNNDTQQRLESLFQEIQAIPAEQHSSNTPISIQQSDLYLSTFNSSQWKIAYVYDSYDFSFGSVLTYSVVPFAILCLLLYLIFHYVTGWLYKPIQSAITEIATKAKPSGSALDEFQLFRQNATIARELADSLQHVVNEKTALVSQRFYRDLILGIPVKSNPLYQNGRSEIRDCCVALFHFEEGEDEDEETLSHDVFFSKNVLISYGQQHSDFHAANISHSDCAVILEAETLEECKKILLTALAELPETQRYRIAISHMRHGIDSIHASYLEANKLMEYRYMYASNDILTAEQIHLYPSDNYHYPIILEQKMIQLLAEGKEKALDIYDDLIRKNFSCRELSPETLHSFIYALLGTMNRTFQELKSSPNDLLSTPVNLESFYTHWNDPNIISSIRSVLSQILLAMQAKNNNSDNATLESMRNYIYENYSSDMTLNDMADALGISAKYCSNLFKKLSNDTFKNFLNRYRIDRAKEMLEKNPDIKIAELSHQVGFNSSNTFIRVFGKYTGMTPGVYLASVHKDDN